jgi:hypothetical protein
MTTPILTAALNNKPRRNPRAIRKAVGEGGGKNTPHNYVAQAVKKTAGAPLGNRNATRRSAESVEREARIDALIRTMSATAKAVIAACDQGRKQRELLAELLRG